MQGELIDVQRQRNKKIHPDAHFTCVGKDIGHIGVFRPQPYSGRSDTFVINN